MQNKNYKRLKRKTMGEICKTCYYNRGFCNRLVICGGFGVNDRVASDYLKDNKCVYFKRGENKKTNKPNFNNS